MYATIIIVAHLPKPQKFATYFDTISLAYTTQWQREVLREPLDHSQKMEDVWIKVWRWAKTKNNDFKNPTKKSSITYN